MNLEAALQEQRIQAAHAFFQQLMAMHDNLILDSNLKDFVTIGIQGLKDIYFNHSQDNGNCLNIRPPQK